MSWRKNIFLIFALSLLPTFIFSPVHAGYNYTYCVWDDQLGCKQVIDCDPGCVPPNLNCLNYRKPDTCGGAGTTPCNCQGPGTLNCSWSPSSQTAGTCRRSGDCGSGYTPSPASDPCLAFDIDQVSCEAKSPGTCVPAQIPQPTQPGTTFDICKDITDKPTQDKCYDCIGYPESPKGNSWTAIGCITTSDPQAFIAWLLGGAIGIAGGIAFLLMLWGGFQIITSTGDPEKLNKGKEILTSAIIGLVVIIFSLFLLQLIGVKILQIPGFGTP